MKLFVVWLCCLLLILLVWVVDIVVIGKVYLECDGKLGRGVIDLGLVGV